MPIAEKAPRGDSKFLRNKRIAGYLNALIAHLNATYIGVGEEGERLAALLLGELDPIQDIQLINEVGDCFEAARAASLRIGQPLVLGAGLKDRHSYDELISLRRYHVRRLERLYMVYRPKGEVAGFGDVRLLNFDHTRRVFEYAGTEVPIPGGAASILLKSLLDSPVRFATHVELCHALEIPVPNHSEGAPPEISEAMGAIRSVFRAAMIPLSVKNRRKKGFELVGRNEAAGNPS
ncbi:MAG: hypothetical protein KDB14_32965 [Planctomycetales bacterium]|nr:hypothetical protein [Planctomycetales bacterium]